MFVLTSNDSSRRITTEASGSNDEDGGEDTTSDRTPRENRARSTSSGENSL